MARFWRNLATTVWSAFSCCAGLNRRRCHLIKNKNQLSCFNWNNICSCSDQHCKEMFGSIWLRFQNWGYVDLREIDFLFKKVCWLIQLRHLCWLIQLRLFTWVPQQGNVLSSVSCMKSSVYVDWIQQKWVLSAHWRCRPETERPSKMFLFVSSAKFSFLKESRPHWRRNCFCAYVVLCVTERASWVMAA